MSFAGLLRSYNARTSAPATVLLAGLLASCSGTTGSSGATGATGAPGPPAPTTTGSALNISTATAITGTITSVTISGPPVGKFQLVDEDGAFIQGLPAADIGFTIAQLVPGQNGTSSQWNSYIYGTVTPGACPSGVTACDGASKTQTTVETATSGTFLDNG